RDLVEKRKWMPAGEFAQAFALIKAMPGPIAFQTAVFLGERRGGFAGASIAAIALNFPAFVAMILLAAFQERFDSSPLVHAALTGMQAAALGLILASSKALFWNYRKTSRFWSLFVIGFIAVIALPAFEPVAIVIGGAISIALGRKASMPKMSFVPLVGLARFPLFGPESSAALAMAGSWWDAFGLLLWNCFKAGAFVFGSGIAIVPLMENDFVTTLRWLTHDEFMNALAFGQITPGPVVITATYIGFKTMGLAGALASTFAIFLAPFVHMTTWFPRAMSRLSRQAWIGDFLLGAIAVVTAAVLTSVVRLAISGNFEAIHFVLIAGACAGVLFTKTPAWVLIPAAGVMVALESSIF
ncbi:MAG: chromate efflux transporter, partial [Bdellovibrionota bacterium]